MNINPDYAVFNPNDRPVDELPVIYGFNNGAVGRSGRDLMGKLLAEDGDFLGGHICSGEWFMPGDLGVLNGSRPDRHEGFREHYPNGYRMDFVSLDDVDGHAGIKAAYERHLAKYRDNATAEAAAAE